MNKIKLGELLQIKHGYAFKSENYVEKSKYALVTLANISESNNFQFNPDKTTYYGSDFPSDFILKRDDLIMPLTEQVIGLFGNSAFVPEIKGVQFLLNQRVGKVIPKKNKVDKFYLHYLLSTEIVRDQLEHRASGTRQRNISPEDVYDVTVYVPDIDTQHKIGITLYNLEKRINLNNSINKILQQQLKLVYDYWFTQFDFPDENRKPYHSTGGEMVYSDIASRPIPVGWKVESVLNNSISQVIKPGVDHFSSKTYLATAEVNGINLSVGKLVDFDTRVSRANMQPTTYSVWFAKMKNSIKHLYLNEEMRPLIENSILSTGFCGLQCTKNSFEYMSSFIEHSYFEIIKDSLAHGATQEAVNNDDLSDIALIIPSESVLKLYHERTKAIYSQISKNICENRELTHIRDWLLPILINDQAIISD